MSKYINHIFFLFPFSSIYATQKQRDEYEAHQSLFKQFAEKATVLLDLSDLNTNHSLVPAPKIWASYIFASMN